MDIFLNKEIIENLDLNDYDIATYVAIRSIYHSDREEFFVSIRMLAYELFGCNISRSALGHIRDSLHKLAEYSLFDIVTTFTQDEFVIRNRNLYFDTYDAKTGKGVYFTMITLSEVHSIMTLSSKCNKVALLRFFINVVGTFNRKQEIYIDADTTPKMNFVGYISQGYIGKLSGVTGKVAANYFKILENAKILYIYRHNKAIKKDDGELHTMTNHYGRFADREYIKQFAIEYEESFQGVDLQQPDKKRALMAKFNYIVSDPEKYISKYFDDELLEIYKYVSGKNTRHKSLGLSDIKDLSVLENVPYIAAYLKGISDKGENQIVENVLDDMFGETEEL